MVNTESIIMRKNNNIFGNSGYLLVLVLCYEFLSGGQLNRTSGLYDLDGDGRKEVLVINSSDRRASLIEFQGEVISDTLWTFMLPVGTYFTDVAVLDIDKNGQPDLVATSKINADSNNDGWLYVFHGTFSGFSNEPLISESSGLKLKNIRPLNLSKVYGVSNYLSVSFETPERH